VGPIVAIHLVGGRMMVAQTASGVALVPLPIDYVMWTPATQRRIEELKTKYQAPGFTGTVDLWLTGKVSPLARQQLTARGITVTEEVGKRIEIMD
jgi:hypothetical protein